MKNFNWYSKYDMNIFLPIKDVPKADEILSKTDVLNPYLEYISPFKPLFKEKVDYQKMIYKMDKIHMFLNNKLKDEVLSKNLLDDHVKLKDNAVSVLQKFLNFKKKKNRRKKNEIQLLYKVHLLYF